MYTGLMKPEFPFLRRLTSDLNYFFDRFGVENPFVETETMWTPTLEVFEKGNELFVKVDVPGLKPEDLTVEITESALAIKGERKLEKEEKDTGFYRCERSYGSFYRSIPLPEGVKIDLAKATMKNGVLEVKMPTTPIEAKKRRLEIAEAVVGEKVAKHAA